MLNTVCNTVVSFGVSDHSVKPEEKVPDLFMWGTDALVIFQLVSDKAYRLATRCSWQVLPNGIIKACETLAWHILELIDEEELYVKPL